MHNARRLADLCLLGAALTTLGAGCATANVSGAAPTAAAERRLTGVVDSYPFPVRTAWVRPIVGRPGLWELHVTDDDNVCGVRGEQARERPLRHQFVATTRWETGASRTFEGDRGDPVRPGFTTLMDRRYGFVPVTEGRLDVIYAPATPDGRAPDGKVRIDARDQDGNEFRGVVDVTTCDA